MPRAERPGTTGVPRWWRLNRCATPCLPHRRGRHGPRAVTDPAHARKHLVRQPGDPASFCGPPEGVCRRAHRKAFGRTTMSHGRGKSDRGIVLKKLPNKAVGKFPRRRRRWRESCELREMLSRRACPGDRAGFMTWELRSMAYDRRQKAVVVRGSRICCITSTRSNACGRLPRGQTRRGRRGGRPDLGWVRTSAGSEPSGFVRPAGPRGLQTPACDEGVHRQGRRE